MRYTCLLVFFIGVSVSAQTGPAGVGNATNNVLWLKADAGTSTAVAGGAVSSWNDQSGNAINVSQATAAQQPLFQPNVINGFPAIQFDNNSATGQNDKLLGPDSPLLDNTNGYTFFTVSRPQTFGNANAIISKRVDLNNNHSFMLFYWTGDKFNTDVQTSNDRFPSTFTFSTNTNYIVDVVYDGTLPAAFRSKLYIGESLHKVSVETSSSVPDNASPLLIGSTNALDDRPFGGYIPEVIIYRQALNKASRIIVNNYLSAKYDIALTANDKYAGDLPANGNYDREVAGIGTDTIQPSGTSGSNLSFATSVAAGLGITSVSGFDAGDYVLAGHASATNAAIQSDMTGMTGSNACRWQRVWYIDVTNTAAALSTNIEFDLSDGGLSPILTSPVPSDYVLLYRPGQTGTWTQLATASALVGDKIRFNNYALALDGYYTLGSENCFASPLPVELTAFTATAQGRDVLLEWETASELNNASFTLERSKDALEFEPLAIVPGAGTTTSPQTYARTDMNPGAGVHYYRLRQTDTDGGVTYSAPVSVLLNDAADQAFTVYPNPNNGNFGVTYSGSDESLVTVTIVDPSGRSVLQETVTGEALRNNGIALAGILSPGPYVVQFAAETVVRTVRIVVE